MISLLEGLAAKRSLIIPIPTASIWAKWLHIPYSKNRALKDSKSVFSNDFKISEKNIVAAGMNFSSIEVELPKRELFYSVMDSFADSDKVMVEFFELLKLLTDLASIRTIVWRLANEVRKTQRRVNALDKMVIPQSKETQVYIESVLEERERENVFVLKALKSKQKGGSY